MRKIPISTGYTISMCVVLTAAMLITLMMPTQSDAEQRKPSGTTTTTTNKCNRNYTACVGDCYLTHGTQGAVTRQCTANCDHAYNRCMGPIIR